MTGRMAARPARSPSGVTAKMIRVGVVDLHEPRPSPDARVVTADAPGERPARTAPARPRCGPARPRGCAGSGRGHPYRARQPLVQAAQRGRAGGPVGRSRSASRAARRRARPGRPGRASAAAHRPGQRPVDQRVERREITGPGRRPQPPRRHSRLVRSSRSPGCLLLGQVAAAPRRADREVLAAAHRVAGAVWYASSRCCMPRWERMPALVPGRRCRRPFPRRAHVPARCGK